MLRQIWFLLFSCFISIAVATSQEPQLKEEDQALEFASQIDSNDLKRHLFYLASDFLQGRETAKKGGDLAARYAANYFSKLGLTAVDEGGDYLQTVPFVKVKLDSTALVLEREPWEKYSDYVVPQWHQSSLLDYKAKELVYAGFGLVTEDGYDDFGDRNWKGKAVLIHRSFPPDFQDLGTEDERSLQQRLKNCREKGASVALVIDDRFQRSASISRRYALAERLQLEEAVDDSTATVPYAMLNPAIVKIFLGNRAQELTQNRDSRLSAMGQPQKMFRIKVPLQCHWQMDEIRVQSQNVVAWLPPTHRETVGEHIVLSAHYDHLGARADAIYNGADDNGSGTTAILEIARWFAEAKEQGVEFQRGILFTLMTGEEKGLLGSRYYSENPVFPLSQAVANVNVDMVGRVDKKYRDSLNYIYVIGADRISPELHEINELANTRGPQLILDYTYNQEDDPNRYYYRSDHYNFAKKGIPAIFFFNGTHPDYHQTSDTPDKIDFTRMSERVRLIFLSCWELMQRPERLAIPETLDE